MIVKTIFFKWNNQENLYWNTFASETVGLNYFDGKQLLRFEDCMMFVHKVLRFFLRVVESTFNKYMFKISKR